MLNPIVFTERVVGDFLRYQLTTYPFTDPNLYRQLRERLNLENIRQSPLMKGPYISLSRPFRQGPQVSQLVEEGILHPHLANIVQFHSVFGHQDSAIRSICEGHTTLISTGTGSGKTESFLYPIISRCLRMRDEGLPQGVTAVLVYPMNALAEDQLERLRWLLVGTGIPFGMYIGKTPEREADVVGKRLTTSSRAAYDQAIREREAQRDRGQGNYAIRPPEERCSREEMRSRPPRILLTNVKQLELVLTRQKDVELFDNSQLEFLVFDEAHTFKGAQGAETACLIRRLRALCGRTPDQTTCIAASATIVDTKGGEDSALNFASRFFGVGRENVRVVSEQYQDEDWSTDRTWPAPLQGNPIEQLSFLLTSLSSEESERIVNAVRIATSIELPIEWAETLYSILVKNELIYQASQILLQPRSLEYLRTELSNMAGRPLSEEEILFWLALGAASRRDGRPLVRPVVHAFIRGLGGAVVTFPAENIEPQLWLSAEDSMEVTSDESRLYPLPIKTCNTCGQHYYSHELSDFDYTADAPGGGELHGNIAVWRPLAKKDGGVRVTLIDRLIVGGDDGDTDDDEVPPHTAPVYYCRYCGSVHSDRVDTCIGCGRNSSTIRLLVVQQRPNRRHYLTSCLCCGARGGERPGTYREPARPVRAVTVSDIHVLAQNMILHGNEDRLLIFADNRQDAAFQAGWMRDHARRFRIRALMLERLTEGPISIGDLAGWLDQRLDADPNLSESVIPEVWRVSRPQAEPVQHANERRHFLHILALRESVTGVSQRIGLEPWGLLRIDYEGLTKAHPFITRWSAVLGISEEDLYCGVANLLDAERRKMTVWDERTRLFSKFWNAGERDVQRGYIPEFIKGAPKGLKLTRESGDRVARVNQWWSTRGVTTTRQNLRKWGIPDDQAAPFVEDLWRVLRNELGLLREAQIRGAGPNGGVVSGTNGACQLDGSHFILEYQEQLWECGTCRRLHTRPTPRMTCMGWHCDGTIGPKTLDQDNYDLLVIRQQMRNDTRMLKPREHSAQVPTDEREKLEREFKDRNSHRVNTLVCTPTLELGVDIGALDSVLMRNVPPLPSNYWQRAGRAGRRHRLAVNITYARPAMHDRAYFQEPLRLLGGSVLPPRFNLRNAELVRKHSHATILSTLFQLGRERSGLPMEKRSGIVDTLRSCFPTQVKDFLFDADGNVRSGAFDVSALGKIIANHRTELDDSLKKAIANSWPVEDGEVVTNDELNRVIDEMPVRLAQVVHRLWDRLQWALRQMRILQQIEQSRGVLNGDEEAIRRRCVRLIEKLKGQNNRNRRDAEGLDDTNTYAVLAMEGFLPGYGLDRGSVQGVAEMPRGIPGPSEYLLPRPTGLALREYVPGNLIYANSHKFVPRLYHLEIQEPVLYRIDLANESIMESNSAVGAADMNSLPLHAVALCDVDLSHLWHIGDDEDHRFQMPVMVLGYEQSRHSGGRAYIWGQKQITYRRAVHFRLVNIGASILIRSDQPTLGYPLCLVTGQSRSPLSSQAELQNFRDYHRERYGREPENIGFYTDVVADALTINNVESLEQAYTIAESLRIAGSQVLDMEIEDLQVLAISHVGSASVDAVLFDPMSGGSGIIDQMIERWPDVIHTAMEFLNSCPSACQTACIDCLMHFRNSHYHKHLNRHTGLALFREFGDHVDPSHDIPPVLPTTASSSTDLTANHAEQQLAQMLRQAGFAEPEKQKHIPLGPPWGATDVDFFYPDSSNRTEGVCIYLDGLSVTIHGNPANQQRDREIREQLRSMMYEVIEIPYTALSDRLRMSSIFYRLGRLLLGRDAAEKIRGDDGWFPIGEGTQKP